MEPTTSEASWSATCVSFCCVMEPTTSEAMEPTTSEASWSATCVNFCGCALVRDGADNLRKLLRLCARA